MILPWPALDHARKHCLCTDEWRVEIHVNHFAEFCYGHFGHGHAANDAGVIDQNVNGGKLGFDMLDEFIHLLLVCNIAHKAMGGNALFLIGFQALSTSSRFMSLNTIDAPAA